MTTQLIKLDLIQDNPYQPRTVDDPEHIEKLARSIAADGLLQLPQARNHQADGKFQLAFGHSRRKAFEWLRDVFPHSEGLPDRYDQYTCMPVEIVELTDEQMYRFAVTENVQRKDLAPTELARSMQRYMDEFGVSSKDVGELFGMSDATVRGMVRLLDLPTEAQQSLDEGRITQGTARTLLSMQKLAPRSVVLQTLEQLHKGTDRWDDPETPEQIVRDNLNDLEEVVDLWSDKQDGKPRAGYKKWLISMKNFPNKLLPALTPEDAAVALGIQDDPAMMDSVSKWLEWGNDVEAGLLPIELVEKLEHLLQPPPCFACPFYAKLDGWHYCGMRVCWIRKSTAWDRETVHAAARDLGIKLYDPEADGSFQVLESYSFSDENKKLYDKRSSDLRLAVTEEIKKGGAYQWGYEGVPDVARVIIVGETLQNRKASKKSQSAMPEGDDDDDTPDAYQNFRQQRKIQELTEQKEDQLFWEAALHVKVLFAALPKKALLYMEQITAFMMPDIEINEPDRMSEHWAEFYRRMLAFGLLDEAASNQSLGDTLQDQAAWLIKTAKEWGVEVPAKSLKQMAKDLDAELDAVSVETKKAKK